MSATSSMPSAALLRNRRATQDLVRLQLQWVLSGNPFSQSLMYGVGYDFQPLFAYCGRNVTGALPVGMDSRNDIPYWPAENRATYKEMCVVPVSRILFSLAWMAMPAQLTGTASAGTELQELRTGTTVRLAAGKFSRTVPPGEYTISCEGAASHLSMLAGGRYEIGDVRKPIDMVLTAGAAGDGEVRIEAHVTGAGRHEIELRAFNGTAGKASFKVALTPGRGQTITWQLKVPVVDTPWAVVVIPDGNMTARQELSGTLHEIVLIG